MQKFFFEGGRRRRKKMKMKKKKKRREEVVILLGNSFTTQPKRVFPQSMALLDERVEYTKNSKSTKVGSYYIDT
jgi:hypothetical protein